METVWRGHKWGALLGATLICSALYYFTFVIHYNNRLVLNTMVVVLCGLSTWLSEVITGSLFLLDGKDKATVDSDSSIHSDDKPGVQGLHPPHALCNTKCRHAVLCV